MHHMNAKIEPPTSLGRICHHGQENHSWQETAGPLIFVMKIFGLYHENLPIVGVEQVADLQPQAKNRSSNIRTRLLMFYQVGVVVVLWLNVIRLVTSFITKIIFDGLISYDDISYGAWLCMGTANSMVLFWACWDTNALPLFEKHWNTHFQNNLGPPVDGSDKTSLVGTKKNKFATVCAVLGCFITVSNTCALSTLTFAFGTESDIAQITCGPFTSKVSCAFVFALSYSTTPAWIFPPFLFSLLCHMISKQFSKLSADFVSTFSESSAIDSALLNSFRKRHAVLCRSVELADNVLSPIAAITYITGIPIAIFLLYLLFQKNDLFSILMYLTWLLCISITLSIVSFFAVKVHEKVI